MTHSEGTAEPGTGEYITGRIISDGAVIEDGVVEFEHDRITYAGPAADFDDDGRAPARSFPPGTLLIPGLVDVHCHGAYGTDFQSATVEETRSAVASLNRAGTTTLLASTVSAPRHELTEALSRLAGLAREGVVAGIHAEGPFLSASFCGAHRPEDLADADAGFVAELIEAAEGQLITMTYAPEVPGAETLVDLLATHGIIPSLGHTGCDAPTAQASLAQAREELGSGGFDGYSERPTVTHLFNAMPPMHHRSPGPAGVCLQAAKEGNAVVELIADNVHLDARTVKMVFDLAGAENIALVSDSMAAAGMADGSYALGPAGVTVSDGVARVTDSETLAGGTATLLDVVRCAVAAGVPLPDAVTAATVVPANILGLADELGSLRLGLRADVLAVSSDLRLEAVLRSGEWLDPAQAPGVGQING